MAATVRAVATERRLAAARKDALLCAYKSGTGGVSLSLSHTHTRDKGHPEHSAGDAAQATRAALAQRYRTRASLKRAAPCHSESLSFKPGFFIFETLRVQKMNKTPPLLRLCVQKGKGVPLRTSPSSFASDTRLPKRDAARARQPRATAWTATTATTARARAHRRARSLRAHAASRTIAASRAIVASTAAT